jgi:hypothetical protein
MHCEHSHFWTRLIHCETWCGALSSATIFRRESDNNYEENRKGPYNTEQNPIAGYVRFLKVFTDTVTALGFRLLRQLETAFIAVLNLSTAAALETKDNEIFIAYPRNQR